MYIVLSAETAKKNDKDIMADFSGYKNRSFVLNAARRNLKSYGKKDMEAALKLISLAEEELKGGKSEDRLILEKLIVKIIKGIDND
jgi:DNA polymerase III delta subunit